MECQTGISRRFSPLDLSFFPLKASSRRFLLRGLRGILSRRLRCYNGWISFPCMRHYNMWRCRSGLSSCAFLLLAIDASPSHCRRWNGWIWLCGGILVPRLRVVPKGGWWKVYSCLMNNASRKSRLLNPHHIGMVARFRPYTTLTPTCHCGDKSWG